MNKTKIKLSNCCWADYMLTESGKTSCYACGNTCAVVIVTQEMIDLIERAREEAIKAGYKNDD